MVLGLTLLPCSLTIPHPSPISPRLTSPVSCLQADMEFCIAILRYYAGIVERKLQPEVLETDDPDFRAKIVKEPIGVIGCITPWNYPLMWF